MIWYNISNIDLPVKRRFKISGQRCPGIWHLFFILFIQPASSDPPRLFRKLRREKRAGPGSADLIALGVPYCRAFPATVLPVTGWTVDLIMRPAVRLWSWRLSAVKLIDDGKYFFFVLTTSLQVELPDRPRNPVNQGLCLFFGKFIDKDAIGLGF